METSTRWIGARPDQERPVSTWRCPAGSVAPNGSSNALLTDLAVSGGESGGYAGPVSRYCVVFQGEKSGWSETSIRPTHLMLAIPIQPGTTSAPARRGRAERRAVHLVGEQHVVERLADRQRPAHVAR